jgi:hypothetical protein
MSSQDAIQIEKLEKKKAQARARAYKYYHNNKGKLKRYYQENREHILNSQKERREAKKPNGNLIVLKVTANDIKNIRSKIDENINLGESDFDLRPILEQYKIR